MRINIESSNQDKEKEDVEKLKSERLKFFYNEPKYPGYSDELRKRKDLVEDSIEGETFSTATLPDGTILNTSEDIHQYLLEPFLDKSDQRVSDVANSYWDKCNDEYLKLLDQLSLKVAPAIAKADLVISISARNEVDIDRAIKSFLETNPGLLDNKNVVFVINDNFKLEDKTSGKREKVLEHLETLSAIPASIVTTSVELPNYTNAGFAKKVGMESILRAMWANNHFCPIQSIDADTIGYKTPDTQTRALNCLGEDGVLVVSSNYDYDLASQAEYPAWGLRCRLMKLIDDEVAKSIYARLYGPSFLIDPISYFQVGGYIPEFAEDGLLAKQFRKYFTLARLFNYDVHDPIRNMGTIFISPSKEFENIKANKAPEAHWFSAGQHVVSNDSLRSETRGLEGEGMLSHSKTPRSVVPAVESVYQYLIFMFDKVKGKLFFDRVASRTLCASLVKIPEIFNYIDIKFANLPTKYLALRGRFLVQKLLDESDEDAFNFPEITQFKYNRLYKLWEILGALK